MLTLTGTLRAVETIGGGVNRKTGERIPTRDVIQVEAQDHRGLFQLVTLTVADAGAWVAQVGKTVSVPVRAYAPGAAVAYVLAGEA